MLSGQPTRMGDECQLPSNTSTDLANMWLLRRKVLFLFSFEFLGETDDNDSMVWINTKNITFVI